MGEFNPGNKMTQRQYNLFLDRAREYKNDHGKAVRMGQSYFNVLFMYWPDAANAIRGTHFDPFYDDGIIDKFLDHLYTNYVHH